MPTKTTTTKTATKATPVKATPAKAPAPLNAAEQSKANAATALTTFQHHSGALTEWTSTLADLTRRLGSGDVSVTSQQMDEAEREVKRWDILVAAATADVTRTSRAVINTSTALADALAPHLAKVIGLEPSTTWCQRSNEQMPENLPEALIVQTKTETNKGDGRLSGECTLYFSRSALHILPAAAALAKGLSDLGVMARVANGWTVKHPEGSTTHAFSINVEAVAPEIPVIAVAGATSEAARQGVGYVLGDVIGSAFRLTESSLLSLRPSLGSNGLFDRSMLQAVSVGTGIPSLYSDTTDEDGRRTVSILVDAKCRIVYPKTRRDFVQSLRSELPSRLGLIVGTAIPGAGRISAVRLAGPLHTADDLSSVDAQVLVSYVSTLPSGQEAPAYVPAPRAAVPLATDDDHLEPGDEDLSGYSPRVGSARDLDAHGDAVGTHPGVGA